MIYKKDKYNRKQSDNYKCNTKSVDNNRAWVLEETKQACKNGIPVAIGDDEEYSLEYHKLSLVLENGAYMKDYLGDENGRIIGIGFYKL